MASATIQQAVTTLESPHWIDFKPTSMRLDKQGGRQMHLLGSRRLQQVSGSGFERRDREIGAGCKDQ